MFTVIGFVIVKSRDAKISTADRWPAFCQAASDYMLEVLERRRDFDPAVNPLQWHRGGLEPRKQQQQQPLQQQQEQPQSTQSHHAESDSLQEACQQEQQHKQSFFVSEEATLAADAPLAVGDLEDHTFDRFFEQQAPGTGQCGRHALNNVFGGPQFLEEDMTAACEALVAQTGDDREEHSGPGGWYSHGVLCMVLETIYPPSWLLLDSPGVATSCKNVLYNEDVAGILVNHANEHWTVVVRVQGALWHLDSLAAPMLLTEAGYKAILAKHPMAFAVVRNDSI